MLQKGLDNLKDRSKEDKQAVAFGGATLFVLILVIGWGYIFIKRLQYDQAQRDPNALYKSDTAQEQPPVQATVNQNATTDRSAQLGFDTFGKRSEVPVTDTGVGSANTTQQ